MTVPPASTRSAVDEHRAHLVVPVKPLDLAKTRLHGAADAGAGRRTAHTALVAAVVLDTVLAARAASGVADVTVVTSDPALRALFREHGVETCADAPDAGLNAALRHGAQLAVRRGARRVGALQADLPALRPEELDAALRASGGGRAFCPDRHGTGTTLLVAGRDEPLEPRFGASSAAAHARSGAPALTGPWPSLRCDVDTAADLEHAARLGLGTRTRRALASHASPRGTAPGGTAQEGAPQGGANQGGAAPGGAAAPGSTAPDPLG
ncbi:hypothetical protein GCM10027174_17360 [Salinifilum aidingensis]